MPAGVRAASPLLPGKGQKGTTEQAGVPYLTLSNHCSKKRRGAWWASPGTSLLWPTGKQGLAGLAAFSPSKGPFSPTGSWEGLHLWVTQSPGVGSL